MFHANPMASTSFSLWLSLAKMEVESLVNPKARLFSITGNKPFEARRTYLVEVYWCS